MGSGLKIRSGIHAGQRRPIHIDSFLGTKQPDPEDDERSLAIAVASAVVLLGVVWGAAWWFLGVP